MSVLKLLYCVLWQWHPFRVAVSSCDGRRGFWCGDGRLAIAMASADGLYGVCTRSMWCLRAVRALSMRRPRAVDVAQKP